MTPPEITGLLESAIYIADMGAAIDFYQRILGLRLMSRGDRLSTFDVAGRQVLLLFLRGGSTTPIHTPRGVIPPHDAPGQAHFAFSITADSLEAWRRHLVDSSVPVESEYTWERGGHSLYFRDPDQNLVELITPGVWEIY